jgi:hypothetical protein
MIIDKKYTGSLTNDAVELMVKHLIDLFVVSVRLKSTTGKSVNKLGITDTVGDDIVAGFMEFCRETGTPIPDQKLLHMQAKYVAGDMLSLKLIVQFENNYISMSMAIDVEDLTNAIKESVDLITPENLSQYIDGLEYQIIL